MKWSVLIFAFICALLLSLHSSSSVRSNTFISSLSLHCSNLPSAVPGDLKLSGSHREMIFSCCKSWSRRACVLFLRASRWKARRNLKKRDIGSLLDFLLWERCQNKAWGGCKATQTGSFISMLLNLGHACVWLPFWAFIHIRFYWFMNLWIEEVQKHEGGVD